MWMEELGFDLPPALLESVPRGEPLLGGSPSSHSGGGWANAGSHPLSSPGIMLYPAWRASALPLATPERGVSGFSLGWISGLMSQVWAEISLLRSIWCFSDLLSKWHFQFSSVYAAWLELPVASRTDSAGSACG